MEKFVQVLFLNSPKKHSVRYDAAKSEADPKVRSLYVSKSALKNGETPPKAIFLTVEEGD